MDETPSATLECLLCDWRVQTDGDPTWDLVVMLAHADQAHGGAPPADPTLN